VAGYAVMQLDPAVVALQATTSPASGAPESAPAASPEPSPASDDIGIAFG
jgi:hypothetical protein